ncbi:MAG TPA: hypothetical protein VI653_10180 [Steroidobacteraceae bacterium]
MTAGFWFTVGVLTGATATAASMPLWRGLGAMLTGRRRIYAMAGAGLAVFASSAALLYLVIDSRATSSTRVAVAPDHAVGTQSASGAGSKALSMQDATTRLEARLEKDGGSAEDWELLAKSYEFLGRTADAERARQHRPSSSGSANNAPMPGPSDLVSQAEMLSSKLSPGTAPPAADAPAARSATATADVATAAEIAGTVSIEGRLASRVDQGATLFIYAKAPDSPGPPLAVMRVAAGNWPVSFRLDDSMAMLPSRRLSQFQKVVVEARISRSGQATPAAGDLYVTSDTVNPSSRKKLALVINHQIG